MKNQALQNIQNLKPQNPNFQNLNSQISQSSAAQSALDSQTPQISIVIPVYNAQPYITRCLESLVNQTYKNIQIIIVDDRGQDDGIQVAEDFVQKYYALQSGAQFSQDCNDNEVLDSENSQSCAPTTQNAHLDSQISESNPTNQNTCPHFTFVQNPTNLGTFHARAAGIRNASAPYIMFADPDDFLAPKACAVMLHTITKTNAHMVQARMSYHPKTLLRVRHNVHIGKLYDHRMRSFLSAGNNTQGLWDKIFRTDMMQQALQDLNFMQPPLNMLEDGLLVFVYSMRASVYVGVRDNIYFYCHNPNSITKDRSVQNFYKKMAHIQKHFDSTARLAALYKDFENLKPQDAQYLLSKYRAKIASTLAVDTRHYDGACFEKTLATLAENGFTKKPNRVKSVYLKSVLLSLRYAYRWQNLARVVMFVFSFGRIKN